jgi:Pentapeptide repeats (8 copies)
MANPEHVAKLNAGVHDWNKWRKENPLLGEDLRQGGVKEFEQHKIDLRHARLEKKDLRGFDLSFADLHRATLWHSDLSGANLEGADLSSVNLTSPISVARIFVVQFSDFQGLLKPTFRNPCSPVRSYMLHRSGI